MTDREFLEDATLKMQVEGIEPTDEQLQYALLRWREKEIPKRERNIGAYGKGLDKMAGFVKKVWNEAERPYNAISSVVKYVGEPKHFEERKGVIDPSWHIGLGKAFVEGLSQKEKTRLHEWMWEQVEPHIPEEAWVARGAYKTVADISQYYTDPRYLAIGKAIQYVANDLLKSIPQKVKLSPESEKMMKDLPKYKHKPIPELEHSETWVRAHRVALKEMLPKEQAAVGEIPKWADEGATRWANFIEKYLGNINAKVAEIQYVTQQMKVPFTMEKEKLLIKVLERLYGTRTLQMGELAKATNVVQQITKGTLPAAEFFAEKKVEVKPELTAEQERQVIRKPVGAFEGEKTGTEQLYPTAEKDIMTGEELELEAPVKMGAGVSPEQMKWEPTRGIEPESKEFEPLLQDYDKQMIGEARQDKPSIGNWFAEAYRQVVNRMHPVDALSRAVNKMGFELQPGKDPAILYRRIYGAKPIAESKLFWKTTGLNATGELEITGAGLQEILKPFARNEQDLKRLMVAHRDIELASRPGEPIRGTKAELSQQVIDKIRLKYGDEKFLKLMAATEQIRQWQVRTVLDPLKEVGALSESQYDKILESNRFYVPFNRVIEELEEYGSVRNSANLLQPGALPIKKIEGSERYLKDPFETMINRTYRVTDFVERQRALNSIVNLRHLSPDLASTISEIEASSALPKVSVFENGERKYFHVPKDLHAAIKGLDVGDMGTLWRLLGVPARTLRAGATTVPEFFGRNVIRDQMTGFVYSKHGYIPFVDFMPGIFNAIGKTDLYWRWAASGGAHSALVSMDKYMANKKLYEVMGGKDFGKYFRNPLRGLQDMSELGEAGTRLGAFGRAKAKGVPDVLAALESRELTLDFAQRGASTKAINQLIAFWNANVLGMDKLGRAHIRHPGRTILRSVIGLTIPSLTLWYINKDNERIQNLPQWRRDLAWNIDTRMLGWANGPIIPIPKPFELGLIYGSLPERIMDWIYREDPDAVKQWGQSVVQSMMPGMIPTVLAPFLEEKANYSFFMQRPLVPSALKGLPTEFQYTPYTTETAKAMGKLIGKSPIALENYVWSYSGGLGRHFMKGLDMALSKYGVLKDPAAKLPMELSDYPLLKGFIAREPIGLGSDPVNKLYDLYEKSDKAYGAVKKLQQEGRGAEVEKYIKKHPEYGLREVLYDFIYGKPKGNIPSISTLLQYRNQILYSDMTPREKKQRLEAIDTAMTTMAYKIVNSIRTGK